jgi:hypothetical protein
MWLLDGWRIRVIDLQQRRRQLARRVAFEDYRRKRASVWYAPRGVSMRPLVRPDTTLLVEFGAANAEIGEIIVFPLGDILVAHRLVARRWRQGVEMLIAKGDAEAYFDPPVPPGELLGVVRALRRGGAGPAISLDRAGLSARLVAQISYWVGRGAWFARRVAAFLPDPLRRMALGAILLLARVTAHILFAPLLWAVLFRIKRTENVEGGEQHEAV